MYGDEPALALISPRAWIPLHMTIAAVSWSSYAVSAMSAPAVVVLQEAPGLGLGMHLAFPHYARPELLPPRFRQAISWPGLTIASADVNTLVVVSIDGLLC